MTDLRELRGSSDLPEVSDQTGLTFMTIITEHFMLGYHIRRLRRDRSRILTTGIFNIGRRSEFSKRRITSLSHFAACLVCVFAVSSFGVSQNDAEQAPPAQKPATPATSAPASQSGNPAQAAPTSPAAPQAPALPPHKAPPSAKTAEEFSAYNAAAGNPDTASAEKAADDFATKFPQSELRGLLYSNIMRRYQQSNDSDKTLEMARKVLTYEPSDPVALVMAATVLAERTREGDLDREERYDEALKYAQRALETSNTDLMVPANASAQQIESAKKVLLSMAHSAIGMVDLNRKSDAAAAQEFQQSIALSAPGPVEPLTYLRLALAQDHLKQYSDALGSANKAVESSPANSPVAMLAKQEVDRLSKLEGSGAVNPAQASPQGSTSPK
jgi:tetratricopeptide (TPR) repeat protein